MAISEILAKLQATTKRNEKTQILESLKGTSEEYLFKRVARLAYEPTINFWVKEVEFPEKEEGGLFEVEESTLSLDNALDVLQYDIGGRKITGNAAHKKIIEIHNLLQDDEKSTFRSVLQRDLKVGTSVKTLNKVWPDLVYDHPYMRASSFNEKNLKNIDFPCISQTKEDGEYEDIIVQVPLKIEFRSRNGAKNNHHASGGVINALSQEIDSSVVLMGEVLVYEDATRQKLMPRHKGNGYLNSNDVDPERLLHILWDVVPYKDFKEGVCKTPYTDRLNMLRRIVSDLSKHTDQIKIIDTRIVNSVDEIIDHFMEKVEEGLEGVLVKNLNMPWKNGTSKDQVKVKVEFECELKIVGFNQGKRLGEWAQTLGSLICESADSKLIVNVGTGISEELKEEIWNNQLQYMKQIVTVKSNDVIASDSHPERMSLFLPRVTKFRKDKNKADTYDRIIEQKEAFVQTLKAVETKED